MRSISILLMLTTACAAVIVDRIDIVVGSTVITQLQLEEEMRVTEFLNNEPITTSVPQQRAAADRLIQQVLVGRDMELSRYPDLPVSVAQGEMRAIRSQYGSAQVFEQKLAQFSLTEATLQKHLALQARTLRFVGFRFRPDVTISDDELKRYSRKRQSQWMSENPGKTPPEELQNMSLLRNSLLEERTDQALNSWLEETRNEVRIVYLDQSLAPSVNR